MKEIWESVNSKSFQCKALAMHPWKALVLQSKSVRFSPSFRPSVYKMKRLQTVLLCFLSIQVTDCCKFQRKGKKKKSYRSLHLQNTMFPSTAERNIRERSLKECQRILIISSKRFSRNSQKYQLHTHGLALSLIQKTKGWYCWFATQISLPFFHFEWDQHIRDKQWPDNHHTVLTKML